MFQFRSSVLTLLMVLLATVPAVGQSQVAPPAPVADTPAESAVGADYLIGPGDTLQVFVWQSPDLSTLVPVRPDGRISTPLVEDIVAVGKTPAQLGADLETALAEFVRTPRVSVIVTIAIGALNQVQVIGQVVKPSGVPYHAGLRVLDVLLAVGGLTEFAAPNRSSLIRKTNGQETKIKLRIGDLLDDGDMAQNLVLEPGDVIVVPQTWF